MHGSPGLLSVLPTLLEPDNRRYRKGGADEHGKHLLEHSGLLGIIGR